MGGSVGTANGNADQGDALCRGASSWWSGFDIHHPAVRGIPQCNEKKCNASWRKIGESDSSTAAAILPSL